MRRHISLALLVLLGLTAARPGHAEGPRLTGPEINAALVGNTAVGTINGKPFRQYFREDGTTVFQREGEGKDIGRWRTTDEDEYCAWWNRGGWSCYRVTLDGDTITWHYNERVAYPATLVTGNLLE